MQEEKQVPEATPQANGEQPEPNAAQAEAESAAEPSAAAEGETAAAEDASATPAEASAETAAEGETAAAASEPEPAAPAKPKRELPPPPVLKGLIGRKLGMTHIYDENGRMVPVTVVELGPCHVVQVRTPEKDGYYAAQIGYEPMKTQRVNKPMRGVFQKAELDKPLRHLKEFEILDGQAASGQEIRAEHVFREGETVRSRASRRARGSQAWCAATGSQAVR